MLQGDAYSLRDTLGDVLRQPASAVVSGLPLVTKPMRTRVRLLRDAFTALAPKAPFIQFTYSVAPPIPKSLPGISTEASERIWMNVPPARVLGLSQGLMRSSAQTVCINLPCPAKSGAFSHPAQVDDVRQAVVLLREFLYRLRLWRQ